MVNRLTALLIPFAAAALFFVGKGVQRRRSNSFWAKGLFTVVGIMALRRSILVRKMQRCEPLPVLQRFFNTLNK